MTDAKFWSFLGANAQHSLLEAMDERDRTATDAFVELCRLYKAVEFCDQVRLEGAMVLVLSTMQDKTRRVCRWAVAYAIDWDVVDSLWARLLARPADSDPLLKKMIDEAVQGQKRRPAEGKPRRKRAR